MDKKKVYLIVVIIIVSVALVTTVTMLSLQTDEPLEVVDFVDIERYSGLWYSVYEIPVYYGVPFFGFDSTKCVNSTAYYTAKGDGTIEVKNSCIYEGENNTVYATAGFETNKHDGNLWVAFSFFRSPYRIIGLDDEYQWAVVGTPNRESLWYLSRAPIISDELLSEMNGISENLGFDTGKLVKVERG